jgi:hypothetical protein
MKKSILLSVTLLAAGPVLAADPPTTNQLQDAIAKLQSAPNFSWTLALKIPGAPFEPGLLKGRAEKDGYAVISQEIGDWQLDAVFKGDAIALKNEGEWKLPDPGDMRAVMTAASVTRRGTPAIEAESLFKYARELKAGEGAVLTSDLTDEGAKEVLSFGPRGGDDGPPPPKNAKGSVKFWLKDGALSKYESHVQGTMAFGPDGEDRDFEVTRTIEIQDVGTTKADVPAEAKKVLEAKTPDDSEKSKN